MGDLQAERARQTRNEYQKYYMREWRKRNPDKVRRYNESYWERQAEQPLEDRGIGRVHGRSINELEKQLDELRYKAY